MTNSLHKRGHCKFKLCQQGAVYFQESKCYTQPTAKEKIPLLQNFLQPLNFENHPIGIKV